MAAGGGKNCSFGKVYKGELEMTAETRYLPEINPVRGLRTNDWLEKADQLEAVLMHYLS